MIKRGLRISALTTLVLASTAAAASGPTVTAKVTPDTPSAASTIDIALTGPFPPGLPSSLSLTAQKGFTSSIKSVSTLCSSTDGANGNCPAASHIGTGSAVLDVTALGMQTVPMTLALGGPSQAGDIGTAYMYGSLDGVSLVLPARVFTPPGGGLELLITKFPALPPGISVTIDSLTLSAHATQSVTVTKTVGKGKHKHKKKTKVTYSVITNPPTCPSTHVWTGSASATFSGQTSTIPFSSPCAS